MAFEVLIQQTVKSYILDISEISVLSWPLLFSIEYNEEKHIIFNYAEIL